MGLHFLRFRFENQYLVDPQDTIDRLRDTEIPPAGGTFFCPTLRTFNR